MANKPLDTHILDKAICFAVKAHSGTERRGKGYPYIIHPMEAVAIVSSYTTDQEMLAAAALHDVVEDCEFTLEELRREFGERVASLVASESDNTLVGVDKDNSWRTRKLLAAQRLAAATYDEKVVAMGDKLSNLRTIAMDYKIIGDEVWKRFHAPGGKTDIEWRYRLLADALSDLKPSLAYDEFVGLLDQIFDAKNE